MPLEEKVFSEDFERDFESREQEANGDVGGCNEGMLERSGMLGDAASNMMGVLVGGLHVRGKGVVCWRVGLRMSGGVVGTWSLG